MTTALLDEGADVNSSDNAYGWTPLHYASARGIVEVVTALLDTGADVTSANKKGATPLDIATSEGLVEIALVLREQRLTYIAMIKSKGYGARK